MERLAKLYSQVTGISLSEEGLKEAGERAWNIWKACNMKEGFCRKDDRFPLRWFEGITDRKDGQETQIFLEDYYGNDLRAPEKVSEFIGNYYDERGWDKELGVPLPEKFDALDLKEEARVLEKSGVYDMCRRQMEEYAASGLDQIHSKSMEEE
jgi:aldehyde:ferredoxin oxidoreductase